MCLCLICINTQAICATNSEHFNSTINKLKNELNELRLYLYKHPKHQTLNIQQYKREYQKICLAASLLKIPCSRIKFSVKPTGVSLAGDYIFINIDEFYNLTYQQLLFTLGHEWGHIFFKHGETQLVSYLKAELLACPKCFSRDNPLDFAIRTAAQKTSVFREQKQVELRWRHELEADSYAVCLMIAAGIAVNINEITSDLDGHTDLDVSGTFAHPPLEMRRLVMVRTIEMLSSMNVAPEAQRGKLLRRKKPNE